MNTPVTGLFLAPSKIQSPVWCLFPPFAFSHALISICGWGLQQELRGVLRFHSPPSGVSEELWEDASAHAIWGLSRAYDATAKTAVIEADDD